MPPEATAKPVAPLSLGRILEPAAAGLPPYAKDFTLRREADGRLFAVGVLDDCDVFIQPRRWKEPTMPANAQTDGAINYGLNLQGLHSQMSGTLQTNDPTFGPAALGQPGSLSTASYPDGRDCGPSTGVSAKDFILPGAIVFAAVLILVFAKLRRAA